MPDDAPSGMSVPPPVPLRPRTIAFAFAAALTLCLLAYLAYAVPGRWISSVAEQAFGATQLGVPRGTATLVGDALVVSRAADDGNTVVSVNTNFRATDYPVVAWLAGGFPANARVALLWRTDVEPARVNKRVLDVQGDGRLVPVDVHEDPHWLGRIVGLALVVQGSIEQPLRIRGVVAKPGGALDTLRDRSREWTAPEPWTGASINTVVGGADVQRLPLPALLAVAVAVAVAIIWIAVRKRTGNSATSVATGAVALALVAWLVLDARWMVNLTREAHATALQFAGKDLREKHLAAQDRDLFAFIEKARGVMPKDPARVFVLADADYFRGRAAYHLYPHNVWFDPYNNAVPPADQLRSGDWLVVYQRRGVQYDAARHSIRFGDGATVAAEVKVIDHGGALFLVQ
jgi:hypothetical protein